MSQCQVLGSTLVIFRALEDRIVGLAAPVLGRSHLESPFTGAGWQSGRIVWIGVSCPPCRVSGLLPPLGSTVWPHPAAGSVRPRRRLLLSLVASPSLPGMIGLPGMIRFCLRRSVVPVPWMLSGRFPGSGRFDRGISTPLR